MNFVYAITAEMYKTINNLNPYFMAEVLVTKDGPYNLRGSDNLVLPKARTNLYGIIKEAPNIGYF